MSNNKNKDYTIDQNLLVKIILRREHEVCAKEQKMNPYLF